jgi:hypothetical protein
MQGDAGDTLELTYHALPADAAGIEPTTGEWEDAGALEVDENSEESQLAYLNADTSHPMLPKPIDASGHRYQELSYFVCIR